MKALFLGLLLVSIPLLGVASTFEDQVRPFLNQYCIKCHGGEKVKGKVDFSQIQSEEDIEAHFELWETVVDVLDYEEMPPEDEPQPNQAEREEISTWYQKTFVDIEAQPGPFQPRRLSASEYRNTLRSLFGFDLQVNIMASEQTVIESSLVMKLLPTDPPGASGFVNDTHGAPLSTVLWDQYSYLADAALAQHFRGLNPDLTPEEARTLLREFATRAFRRPLSEDRLKKLTASLEGKTGPPLIRALKTEFKVVLMSPQFLYRGLLMEGEPRQRQPVDAFELAERLSYFLWEDMPDAELSHLAANGSLLQPEVLEAQVDRMLASPKARNLAESFAVQWLALDEIDDVSNRPIEQNALKSQPIDFLHYLFTENRPVAELIDSDITYANDVTASFYPGDRKQMTKYSKPKGVEKVAFPNQRLTIENTPERGGILTMPGILAMNHGPIIRGTWMLRRILGEHLGEPPADVPPIQASAQNKNLSFREKFEAHRDNAACARCHDKIDPLGFALQGYDERGAYMLSKTYAEQQRRQKVKRKSPQNLDTSGRLPSGESFANFAELKTILLTSKRPSVVRNSVEQTLAYALCRKLERHDRPTVDAITEKLLETDGTWRDLFLEIALSLPFRETIFSPEPNS